MDMSDNNVGLQCLIQRSNNRMWRFGLENQQKGIFENLKEQYALHLFPLQSCTLLFSFLSRPLILWGDNEPESLCTTGVFKPRKSLYREVHKLEDADLTYRTPKTRRCSGEGLPGSHKWSSVRRPKDGNHMLVIRTFTYRLLKHIFNEGAEARWAAIVWNKCRLFAIEVVRTVGRRLKGACDHSTVVLNPECRQNNVRCPPRDALEIVTLFSEYKKRSVRANKDKKETIIQVNYIRVFTLHRVMPITNIYQ